MRDPECMPNRSVPRVDQLARPRGNAVLIQRARTTGGVYLPPISRDNTALGRSRLELDESCAGADPLVGA